MKYPYKRAGSGRRGSYIVVHRQVWEEAHGPIPPGHVVHHKNGDKRDNRLENLQLMSEGEHARLHNVQPPKACATEGCNREAARWRRYCTACAGKRQREQNPESAKAALKRYEERHPERRREISARYEAAHRAERADKASQYRDAHPGAAAEYMRKRHAETKEQATHS